MFNNQAIKAFPEADIKLSNTMTAAIGQWRSIMHGSPSWVSAEDDVDTINFGNVISERAASLTTLDIGLKVSGSARADWMQEILDTSLMNVLRDKIAVGLSTSGIILKPIPGAGIEVVEDDSFVITGAVGGKPTGVIFRDVRRINKKVYTRYEWQHIDANGDYHIENRAFVSNDENEEGKRVSLSAVADWAELPEDEIIKRKDGSTVCPLFAYFHSPRTNKIDTSSPYGVPIYSEAVPHLKGLDIAWSRNDAEVEDSKHVTFMPENAIRYNSINEPTRMLPRFVRGVELGGMNEQIHEHTATLLTDSRWSDINNRVSYIGTVCGFSPGAFSVDKKTGLVTATQVESDDRDTIETIKDIRDALKRCINDLLDAMDVIADLYDGPKGAYEATFSFGDITYNYEEDRANWWRYVTQGKIPAWKYFEKFEGMTREEYEELESDLPGTPGLFNDSE